MTGRVLVIANPISGGGRGEARARALAHGLGELGIGAEIRLTTPDRTGRQVAEELGHGSYRAVAVVGGDGSLNDVVNGLRDSATPVAVLPSGTANVWAREGRMPRSPAGVARAIAAGHTIEAVLGTAGGRLFFLFVGAGIDARIVRRVERRRKALGGYGGMLQWLVPAWLEFVGRPLPRLSVEVEGRTIGPVVQVLVTRIRGYAGFMRMPAGIDLADGCLHVLAFPRRRKPVYVLLFVRALLGRLRPGRDLVHVPTTGPVRIAHADAPEPYHVDGDDAGDTAVEIALSGRTVRLVVP